MTTAEIPTDDDLHRHTCEFGWCVGNLLANGEHYWLEYTQASLRSGDPRRLRGDHEQLKVGIGTVYDEGELPCIVVHIDGGPHDDDTDAHLTIAEAVRVRGLLDRAITVSTQALEHVKVQMVGGAR